MQSSPHPLDDSRELIASAWENFQTLDDDMIKVTKEDPNFMGPPKLYVDQALFNVIEIPVIPVLPRRWGTIFTEMGNAARSALDYLVYELSFEAGGNPEREQTTFPIAVDRDAYWRPNREGVSYRDRVLAGVADEWKRKIDDLQPYNRIQDPTSHPLAQLNRLSNRQKHRKPHLPFVVVMAQTCSMTFDSLTEIRGVRIRERGNEMYVESSILGNRRMTGMRVVPKAKPDSKRGAYVGFGYERLGTGDMKDILEYVEKILVWFEPAFEPPAN
jgi:hypothetical protein